MRYVWHMLQPLQDNASTLGGVGNSNNPESEHQTWLGTVFSDMTWEPNDCIKTAMLHPRSVLYCCICWLEAHMHMARLQSAGWMLN